MEYDNKVKVKVKVKVTDMSLGFSLFFSFSLLQKHFVFLVSKFVKSVKKKTKKTQNK